jgi:hypothetical protein
MGWTSGRRALVFASRHRLPRRRARFACIDDLAGQSPRERHRICCLEHGDASRQQMLTSAVTQPWVSSPAGDGATTNQSDRRRVAVVGRFDGGIAVRGLSRVEVDSGGRPLKG